MITELPDRTFISIQQNTRITIFNYPSFKTFATIEIPNLQLISTFEFNAKNYLFAAGSELHLYQITSEEVSEIAVSGNYGQITHMLPMKITSYRDDIVILIEHRLNFTTHHAAYVNVLYFHDGNFKTHEEVPCWYYRELNHGLECLVEEDTDLGINGGIGLEFMRVDKNRLLLPRLKSDSELFSLEYKLLEHPNPIENDIEQFLELRNKIVVTLSNKTAPLPEKLSGLVTGPVPEKGNSTTAKVR